MKHFRFGIVALAFYFLTPFMSHGQWVKEDDSSKVWLKSGIYLSEASFFSNIPDYLWVNPAETDWRYKDSIRRSGVLLYVKEPAFHEGNIDVNAAAILGRNDSSVKALRLKQIWGFSLFGTPYVHVPSSTSENFIKVQVLGTISYLNYTSRVEGPFLGPQMTFGSTSYHMENVQLIVDFESKEIVNHSKGNLEDILHRDKELFNQYRKEKKKSKTIYRYVKMYNDKHPISLSDD